MAESPDGSDPSEDEDDIVLWQEVLDQVVAGRSDLGCPFCKAGTLLIERGASTGRLRVSCPSCRKFIEGALPASDFE